MLSPTPYIMRDQVHDFVPNVMTGSRRRQSHLRTAAELVVFAIAASAYLAALALTA
ncbi:MAG: hypothetical protein RLZ44_9 [Pseudomonadota bacterium]|jgi:hypothetical protein